MASPTDPESSKRRRLETKMSEKPDAVFVLQLQDLPPMEAALSIEKVRNLIFAPQTKAQLKNCRLVSSLWNEYCTDALMRKKIQETESNNHYLLYFSKCKEETALYSSTTNGRETLQNLTTLLNNPSTQSFLQVLKRVSLNQFDLADPTLDLQVGEFLTKHGHHIQKLRLEFWVVCDNCHIYTGVLPENQPEGTFVLRKLIDFMGRLLLDQAPNLTDFELEFRTFTKPLDWDSMCADVLKRHGKSANFNLKTIKLRSEAPFALFECLSDLSPNLEEMDIPSHNCLHYFIQHKNRLYLLKELSYIPSCGPHPGNDRNDSFFQTIANMDGKLELKRFSFCFSRLNHTLQYDGDTFYKELPQISDTFIKILQKSAHSLENLTWPRMGFLEVASLPRMSKVKGIYFVNDDFSDDDDDDDEHIFYFPRRFRMSETFPNLERIAIHEHCDLTSKPDNYFLDNDEEVIESVRVVESYGGGVCHEQFQRWFPNAQIQ